MTAIETSMAPRPPRHRVNPRALRWWTVQAALTSAAALLPQLVALELSDARWLVVTTSVTACLAAAYVLIMPSWRYRVHRWEADEHAVYTLAGWLHLEWRVVPISRIQTIDIERTLLQRLFGLATVTVTTASAAGPVRIVGLDAQEADRLVHRLTAITQADRGDAT